MTIKTTVYSALKPRNRPSFFATPLAWAVADFTQTLIEDSGGVSPRDTGLIVVSDECSLDTIRELSRSIGSGGVSPLRFAGASPSILAGLPALQQGIRGPTVCLTMPPDNANDAMAAMIHCWIRHNGVDAVIAVTHRKLGKQGHQFKGLIARSADGTLARRCLQLTGSQSVADA